MSRSSSQRRNPARKIPPAKRQPRQNRAAAAAREAATRVEPEFEDRFDETIERVRPPEPQTPLWKRMVFQLTIATVIGVGAWLGVTKAFAEEAAPAPSAIVEEAEPEEKPGFFDKLAARVGKHVDEGIAARVAELDERERQLDEREEALEVKILRSSEVHAVAAALVQCSSAALAELEEEIDYESTD